MDELWDAYLDTRSIEDRDKLILALRDEVFRLVYKQWGCCNRKQVESEVGYQVTVAVAEADGEVSAESIASTCRTEITTAIREIGKERSRLESLSTKFGTDDMRKWWRGNR